MPRPMRLMENKYTAEACPRMLAGIIVDGVSEVLNVAGADIENAPDFGAGADTSYVVGMAKVKGAIKILLDIDQVMIALGDVTALAR